MGGVGAFPRNLIRTSRDANLQRAGGEAGGRWAGGSDAALHSPVEQTLRVVGRHCHPVGQMANDTGSGSEGHDVGR